MERKRIRLVLGLFVFIMLVGRVGLSIPKYSQFFADLTPITLLICFSLIIYYQKNKNLKFFFLCGLVWLLGMGSEWIGIHTGYLFGNYEYTKRLGFSLFNVPIIIGINWVMLCLSAMYIFKPLTQNRLVAALFGAILLVGFDIYLENFATEFGLWSWKNSFIPLSNYRDWFLIAFLGNLFIYPIAKRNPIALPVFIILFLFIFSFSFFGMLS